MTRPWNEEDERLAVEIEAEEFERPKLRGRPPGPALTDLESKHLQLLFEIRAVWERQAVFYREQLNELVVQLQAGGTSYRQIAAELDVAGTTVQRWAAKAPGQKERTAVSGKPGMHYPPRQDLRALEQEGRDA